MKYLAEIIKGMGGKVSPISSPITRDSVFFSTNASVTALNGNIVLNTRLSNYLWTPWIDENIPIQRIFNTGDLNKIVYSYNEMGIWKYGFEGGHFIEPPLGQYKFWNMYAGLEDMRIVTWNDRVYGIGARPDLIENKVVQQLIEFTDDFKINRSWILETNSNIEKGWLPIEGKPFTFMYDIAEGITITLNPDELNTENPNHIDLPAWSGKYSGSTPLIRYKDGYVCLGHIRIDYKEAGYRTVRYNHYFVKFNNELKPVSVGQLFNFLTDGIEFACGLCNYDNDVLLTFSVGDSNCHMIKMSKDIFEQVVEMTMSDDEVESPEKPTSYFHDNYDYFNPCDALAVAMGYLDKDDTEMMYGAILDAADQYDLLENDKETLKPILMRMILRAKEPYYGLREVLDKLYK